MAPVYGVYRGTVTATDDPEQLGRVRVAVAAVAGIERAWAPVATLAAGANRGTWFVPESGDEVFVAFEAGDARRPIVLGSLWTAQARPPSTDTGRAVIRMRAIELEDQNGNGIALEPAGIRVRTPTTFRAQVGAVLEANAATCSFNSGVARFGGVVQTTTLIANSVVASSYTPGAGNIW
jgi:phage baseplate assembly protein V